MIITTLFNRTKKYLLTALFPFLALCVTVTTTPVWAAEGVIATIPLGYTATSIAVNPVTNKIYVASPYATMVIDGATNTSAAASTTGDSGGRIAVNPVTNKIYVTNAYAGGNSIRVIDGFTNTTSTVAVGIDPYDIAVNPVTNKIYVANTTGNSVTVVDGVTNSTTTVAVGSFPWTIAVNQVTNKIYVANRNNATVTVIDGATNAASTVAVGIGPTAIAVNAVTNKIYVANQSSSNTVTVIDGFTNTTTTVAVAVVNTIAGFGLEGIVVNQITNKIYVASGFDTVTVIDGASNATSTIAAVGDRTYSLAVNSATNKIYAVNVSSNSVTVIDGATNTIVTTFAVAGRAPIPIVLNPVTNRVYVGHVRTSYGVTVIGELNTDTTPPTLTMPNLADSYTVGSAAVLTFSATDTQSQIASISATLNGSSVSSGSMVVLNQLGLNTFTLTATDTAGNTATQADEFVVSYGFGGFLPPLTADSRTTFHLGSVIPVKFNLYDVNGAPISTAVAHLSLQKFSGDTPVGDAIDATSVGNADTGNLFRYSDGQYIYNLSTKLLTAGIWSIQAMLDDGTIQTIMIGLTSK